MQFLFVSLLPTYLKFATFPKGFYYLLLCCDSALHTVSLQVTNKNRKLDKPHNCKRCQEIRRRYETRHPVLC